MRFRLNLAKIPLIAAHALVGLGLALTSTLAWGNFTWPVRNIVSTSQAENSQENVSLAGECADPDRQQLHLATDFAFNSLGLGSRESLGWAKEFNRTHDCHTIQLYSSRFTSLYQFAILRLKVSAEKAREFALVRAEEMNLAMIQELVDQHSMIFALTHTLLGAREETALEIAQAWINRKICEGPSGIARIAQSYERHFEYAFSTLRISSSEAEDFARKKSLGLSTCSDLLRKAFLRHRSN